MASRKVPDFYARRARELGYAARSAFKLLEMHEKFRVVKGSVLDLGSHPGAWLQVASRAMPPDAFALGVDLQETSLENMRHVDATRVRVVRRDVFELDELEIRAMRRDAGRPGDVFGTVLSDLAPRTTGSKATATSIPTSPNMRFSPMRARGRRGPSSCRAIPMWCRSTVRHGTPTLSP